MIKYFSAFAGIGGFDEGIRRAIPDAECIGYSEIDKYAIKIYEKHFPDRINFGNIKKIKPKDLPDFGIFCGGFPCQDVSIAGKRRGLCGTRSGLFFEIIRIIREKKPMFVFLENVKGLFSSNNGWDFARVLIELDGAGYDAEWQIFNSKNFGVPQNRERVFIIGHFRGKSWIPIFPFGESNKDINEGRGQQEPRVFSNAIDSSYYKGADGKRQLICINNQPRSGDPKIGGTGLLASKDYSFTLHRNPHIICDSGHSRKKKIRTELIDTLRANTGAGSNTIVNSIRRLTPIECERLQGFPDGWTEGISDTNRYKCLGNAVTVNVIEAICEKIKCNMENGRYI